MWESCHVVPALDARKYTSTLLGNRESANQHDACPNGRTPRTKKKPRPRGRGLMQGGGFCAARGRLRTDALEVAPPPRTSKKHINANAQGNVPFPTDSFRF